MGAGTRFIVYVNLFPLRSKTALDRCFGACSPRLMAGRARFDPFFGCVLEFG